MSEIMIGLKYVKVYIDDILVITKVSWENRLNKFVPVLDCLAEAGVKVNIKHFFLEN